MSGGGRPPLPGELAPPSLRRRALASLVDLVVVGLLGLGALTLLGPDAPVEVRAGALLVATSVPTFLVEVAIGRSLGKAALQLRHERPDRVDRAEERGDRRVRDAVFGSFLVRWGAKWFVPGMVLVLLPWTWAVLVWVVDGVPALVGDRRALHDLLAGTRVWELVTAGA